MNEHNNDSANEHWVLDKRIPLAVLIAIIVQSGAAVWWASSMAGRVTMLETNLTRIDLQGSPITRERLVALEQSKVDVQVKLQQIESGVGRMNDKLDEVLYGKRNK